ncbi:glutamate decarboxylase [Streptomyces sp. AJS327]|uniref:glutamate decarboxylase n=1 Tax=Streptomyces sp. AJS327 TaxID=2545265 RepID=UPI0015DF3F99|nr:glutamate decarboxylase [Streptomyces sp. AJS327]MBA0052361.1 glutamate decarboxylase [Streptomyces sp. AJS327]
MAVHYVPASEDEEFDDFYAIPISEQRLPKYRVPDDQSPPSAVYNLVLDELALDGNSSQNLATFCTTWAERETHDLMDACLAKNMVDKDEYPLTAEIEARCVHMLARLWHSPADQSTMGCSTTGSSEAAMLGGLALKWRWRQRRRERGLPSDRPNLVCGPVQVCWQKFARYFDVELREIPLEPGASGLRPHQLPAYVDENTIGVVAILGVTYTCEYEPVRDIAAQLDIIQQDTGIDVPIHVDAASGGFVAPFLHPEIVWDFSVERVASINASGHKYGMAPLGVGWVIWRTADLLPEDLVFRVDYLGGELPTFALNFSRPGGQVAAQYYNLLRYGHEGYRRVLHAGAEAARGLAEQASRIGPLRILYDGQGALPAVVWTLDHPESAGFTLYELSERLHQRGWQVPAYPLPPDRQDTVIQRVLVRHGIGYDKLALLGRDVETAVRELTHRADRPGPRSGFHH